MGDFRYRQSDWQYYPDGVLHRRMRLADLLLCEIFNRAESVLRLYTCLLYTSDAADEEDSVDLGGRRIIKKKKKEKREDIRIKQHTRQERLSITE